MNEKVKILLNKKKILDSIENNQSINLIILLLIVKYSISGNVKTITLAKLAYIFDVVTKDKRIEKSDVLLSKPWNISNNLRKLVLIAYEQNLLNIENVSGKVKFSLKERAASLVNKIEKGNLFIELVIAIENISLTVKESDLSNQNLIW